jgi:hypothetical protein
VAALNRSRWRKRGGGSTRPRNKKKRVGGVGFGMRDVAGRGGGMAPARRAREGGGRQLSWHCRLNWRQGRCVGRLTGGPGA